MFYLSSKCQIEQKSITISGAIYLPGAKMLIFITKRPLVWLQAFEQFYAHNPLFKCKWVNTKCPETKLFCETKIHVYSINVPYVSHLRIDQFLWPCFLSGAVKYDEIDLKVIANDFAAKNDRRKRMFGHF